MVTVLMFERHTAESCPVGNEKAMKVQQALAAKLPEISKKYGIKVIGGWTIHNEHLMVYVLEAPNFEVIDKMGLEPEVLAWRCFSTAEFKTAIPMEEVNKMLAAMAKSK